MIKAEMRDVPLIVWGAHRVWTKDHPKRLDRKKIPFTVRVGAPLPPTGTAPQLDTAMRQAMTTLLHEIQEHHPHPVGAHWVPRRLGGGAPTPAEATLIEEAELAERARQAGRL